MSTPVAHGRTKSPGGGEMQTATPRILAAEPGQRQRMDLEKDVWRAEQRESEEAGASGRTELRDDGGTLAEGDRVGAAVSEGAEQGGAVDDDWAWMEEERRKATIAMNAAILQMPWLWERTGVPTGGSRIEEREQAPTKTGGAGGDLELQEQLSGDGHTDEAQEMEVDGPGVHRTAQRTTSTSWAVGSNIAPQHRYLVQEAYDSQRRYSPGEEVALMTGQLRHQYRIAEVSRGTGGIEDENLSGSRLELRHGSGQPLTWEQHCMIRQLYTQCSRRPGEVIGPRDITHIRSHRPRTSMHWEGDVVAVPFIWAAGQQGFRYARICAKDALTEAGSKGLYQLDGGGHNPRMLRARGSFYAIDRTSPPRAQLEDADIQEVPGRKGARTQDEWKDGTAWGTDPTPTDFGIEYTGRAQMVATWSEPVTTDL